MIKQCRECKNDVSTEAFSCPKCGCPYPARTKEEISRGVGFEYKSKTEILGLPLLHIAFKFTADRRPVVAKGIISIGQFGIGIINISQFGIGLFSLSQFAIAGFAVAQFAFAYSLIAQLGIYLHHGKGMLVISLADTVKKFAAGF